MIGGYWKLNTYIDKYQKREYIIYIVFYCKIESIQFVEYGKNRENLTGSYG